MSLKCRVNPLKFSWRGENWLVKHILSLSHSISLSLLDMQTCRLLVMLWLYIMDEYQKDGKRERNGKKGRKEFPRESVNVMRREGVTKEMKENGKERKERKISIQPNYWAEVMRKVFLYKLNGRKSVKLFRPLLSLSLWRARRMTIWQKIIWAHFSVILMGSQH